MSGQSERRRRRQGLVAALMLAASLTAQAESDSGALEVTAKVLARTGCRFSSGSFPVLNFGSIDQSSTTNATAATTATVSCRGNILSFFNIVVDNGANSGGTGARRLRHQTLASELMPYALTVSPTTGWFLFTGSRTINITGTITPANFQSVAAGPYTDSVTLTLNP
jgi:spore coat protein U-like protein